MGLFETIQNDIKGITENLNDFGVSITFTNPNTSPTTVKTVTGTIKKHTLVLDEFGQPKANAKTTTCSVSALTFNAAGYPYTTDGVVDFKGHTVTWTDVLGVPITYAVNEWKPDLQTGLIVFILGDYGD